MVVTIREVDTKAVASQAPLTITTRGEREVVSLETSATVMATTKNNSITVAGATKALVAGAALISVTSIHREAVVTIITVAERITKTEETNRK